MRGSYTSEKSYRILEKGYVCISSRSCLSPYSPTIEFMESVRLFMRNCSDPPLRGSWTTVGRVLAEYMVRIDPWLGQIIVIVGYPGRWEGHNLIEMKSSVVPTVLVGDTIGGSDETLLQ